MIGLLPAAAQSDDFTVSGVYYFGCDGSFVDAIKSSLPVHVGDKHSRDDIAAMKNTVANGVWKQIRSSPNEVAIVDCGNHTWNLYISLPGRSVVIPTFTSAPVGKEQLPAEGKALYDDMIKALVEMLSGNGPTGEDDSRGYSLSLNPNLREKELALRQWALQNDAEIRKVLKFSGSAEQRRIAAEALGYVDPSKYQIDALVDASNDQDAGVRNNAIRALACIAGSNIDLAKMKMIPPDRFIAMLNSDTWTDRNKAMFLLTALCKQDPSLPQTIRKQALQALVEISCWDEPHAAGARFVLGKVDGLSEEQLNKLFLNGDVEAIVKAARGKNLPNEKEPKPSLPELGVILHDVFLADQSDLERTKAPDCYAKLLSEEPKFIGTRLEPDYYYVLSFEALHMGQHEALNHNTAKSLEYFSNSLKYSKQDRDACIRLKQNPQSADLWSNYISATIAYMQGNLGELESHKTTDTNANAQTIDRLINGLRKYGAPDYKRDY